MGTFKGKPLPKFIELEEVLTESFDEPIEDTNEPVGGEPAAEEPVDAPVEGSEDPTQGAGETPGEGEPEVLKVYLQENEEDLQELRDAGVLGEDEELPEDGIYIKIKALDGTEQTLLFKEKDPEGRIAVSEDENEEGADAPAEEGSEVPPAEPVEEPVAEGFENDFDTDDTEDAPVDGSEEPVEGEDTGEETGEDVPTGGRFDTELCAEYGEHEYVIAAEIEVSEDGQVEDLDVPDEEEGEEPQVQVEPTEDEAGTEDPTKEEPVTESRRVLGFEAFLKNRK